MDEAFGVFGVGGGEGFLAVGVDEVGLAAMNLVWRHESDAGMMVVVVVP